MPQTKLAIDGVPLATVERLNRARTVSLDRYGEEGCIDRFGYLRDLASTYGIAMADVILLADLLGPEEDFDGLATTLEDMSL